MLEQFAKGNYEAVAGHGPEVVEFLLSKAQHVDSASARSGMVQLVKHLALEKAAPFLLASLSSSAWQISQ